ncbi:MAG: hypothetical protein Q8Q89_05205 [bacterium]|nr:hypothetical protein [bacterium]
MTRTCFIVSSFPVSQPTSDEASDVNSAGWALAEFLENIRSFQPADEAWLKQLAITSLQVTLFKDALERRIWGC